MRAAQDIVELGVAGLGECYRSGSLSPVTVTEFYLSQIALLNPRINAVLDLYAQEAHAAARESALRYKAGKPLSKIDGVPIGVKANIAVNGRVCHAGIKAYEDNIADADAQVVTSLKAAGAVILGSLNMEEGALGAATDNPWFGKTQNPLKPGYTPGGSSGGSAAAVAAGMMPVALGSDTMGSVRIPSAYCGLVGHKPSRGLVSSNGLLALSTTLDCVGPHARNVEDARLILEGIAGQKINTNGIDFENVIIGALDWGDDVAVENPVRAGFDHVISVLKQAGAKIIPVKLSNYDFSKTRRAGLLVSEVEGANIHAQKLRDDPEGFSDHFRSLLEWGANQSPEKIEAAYQLIAAQEARAAQIFETCEVLIAPTAPQMPFKFSDDIPANQADFTAFANFAGLPSTAIPSLFTDDDLLTSVQIMAAKGEDGMTLVVAEKLQGLI